MEAVLVREYMDHSARSGILKPVFILNLCGKKWSLFGRVN